MGSDKSRALSLVISSLSISCIMITFVMSLRLIPLNLGVRSVLLKVQEVLGLLEVLEEWEESQELLGDLEGFEDLLQEGEEGQELE